MILVVKVFQHLFCLLEIPIQSVLNRQSSPDPHCIKMLIFSLIFNIFAKNFRIAAVSSLKFSFFANSFNQLRK